MQKYPVEIKARWYAQDLDECGEPAPVRVVSVHEEVINLQPAGWTRLLMLTAPSLPRGPACVGLPAHKFALCRDLLRPPATGAYGPGLLRFAEAPGLDISWRASPAVSFDPPEKLACNPGGLRRAIKSHIELLRQAPAPSAAAVLLGEAGGEDFFRRAVEGAFPRLVVGLWAGKKQDFYLSCRSLVGLGRGSTPTGDDLIFGSLIACHYYSRIKERPWSAPAFPEGAPERTALPGQHMLELGRRGLAPDPVRGFMLALFRGNTDRRPLQRLLRVGAATGYDAAVAVLLTLEILTR